MKGEIRAAKGDFKQALELLGQAAGKDRPQEPKEYQARAEDLAGDREGAKLIYQRIVDTSLPTWISGGRMARYTFRGKATPEELKGRVN